MEKCEIDVKATKEAIEALKEKIEREREELAARLQAARKAMKAEREAIKKGKAAKKAKEAARAEELAKTRWVNQRTVAFVKRPINWRNYFECHKIVCYLSYYEYK